jgi:tetratricopeptide (TPR) repeat protein/tRNA A-37 threonylcarbamoyl transferase component Bud32
MPFIMKPYTAFVAVTSLFLAQVVAHADDLSACQNVAEKRITTCAKSTNSRFSKDQCVTTSIDGPAQCKGLQNNPDLLKTLDTYYDDVRAGSVPQPAPPPHNGGDANPDNPSHHGNGSSGGNNTPSSTPAQPDAFVQHILDDIKNGGYSSMDTHTFWRTMMADGMTREEALELMQALKQSNSPLSPDPEHNTLPEANENNSAMAEDNLKKALAASPKATSDNYLNSKGLSSDALAKKLGATSGGDATSAVVVGGSYSQPLRAAHTAKPDTSSAASQPDTTASAPAQDSAAKTETAAAPQAQSSTQTDQIADSSDDARQSTAYAAQANMKMALKDYLGAVAAATNAINKFPGNYSAYTIRAAAENYLNRYDDAINDATYVIKNDPQNAATAYNIRAWANAQKGNLAEALADASAAIQLDKNMASAYYNRALIEEKMGNYRKMLEDLRDASAIDHSYDSRFRDAYAKYKAQVPDFQYKGAAFPSEDSRSDDQTPPPASWSKVYILLGGLAAGVLIVIQLLKSFRSKGEEETHPVALMNQFLLVRKLGEGGMGVVYEGYDKTLKRKVAIKKLRSDMGLSPEAKEQLLNEARTTASLRHPNIVDIYTVFEIDGDLFLVLEYVEGVTLESKLDKEGRLTLQTSKSIFKPICRALDFAHNNNIIHRDLKPGNIMISSAGVVKVMDFGVARQLDEARSSKTVSGTPAYMPPEQQKGFVKKESDIYSLGICLYECLTGHVPWDLEGFDPSRNKIIPPSHVVPALPKELDSLLEEAINPNLETRIPSANKFWELLDAVPN